MWQNPWWLSQILTIVEREILQFDVDEETLRREWFNPFDGDTNSAYKARLMDRAANAYSTYAKHRATGDLMYDDKSGWFALSKIAPQ